MRQLRILRVVARLNLGGPARQIEALHRHLGEGFEQLLVTGRADRDELDMSDRLAAITDVYIIPTLGRELDFRNDIVASASLAAVIRRFRPDILHTHTAKAGVVGRVVASLFPRTAIVHTFHGHLLHGYFGPRRTWAVGRVEKMLAQRSDRLLAVGRRVMQELLSAGIGHARQYEVVPPGIVPPLAIDRDRARRQLDIPRGARVVAFAGRLTQVKRPDRLIEVARRVIAEDHDAMFVVAGGGDLETWARAAAGDLGRQIRFTGWMTDVGPLFAAADVALLTSDNEGMPVSLIEAAMLGCPAVTTDVGSASEVVLHGQTGLVCDTRVESLSVGVLQLLRDIDERERMSIVARRHSHEQFGPSRLAVDHRRIYSEVARSRRGRSA